jgi:hypothetical protein
MCTNTKGPPAHRNAPADLGCCQLITALAAGAFLLPLMVPSLTIIAAMVGPIVSRTPRGGLAAKREGRNARNEQLLDVPFRRTSLRYTLRMASCFMPADVMLTRHCRGIHRHHDRPFRSEGSIHVCYHTAALGFKRQRAARCGQPCACHPRPACEGGRATTPARRTLRWCRRCDCKCPPVRACGRIGDLKPFR